MTLEKGTETLPVSRALPWFPGGPGTSTPGPAQPAVCMSACMCVRLHACMCVCVSCSPSPAGRGQTPPPFLSQPLFKKFSHNRWAASEQTMESIVRTVENALPEFTGLRDCFQEVRRPWPGGWGLGPAGAAA